MRFQYLGTSAAEGWPGLFCDCDSCRRAQAAGGRNIRTRSQAIIDNRLLIDFPPDTYQHVLREAINLADIKACLITHNHSDHLYPLDLEMRQVGYAHLADEQPLVIYGTQPTGEALKHVLGELGLAAQNRVIFEKIKPFEPFMVGCYTITALKADHDITCEPVIYLVSDGSRCVLYAHDTGYFPDETWAYLEKSKPRINLVSLDCTCCTLPDNRYNHMNLETCGEVYQQLMAMGCTGSDTIACLNHFSHNGLTTYDDLVPLAKAQGFQVSYDGMILNL